MGGIHTILGAGGAIGGHLARELVAYAECVRLVSRNPQKVNTDDQLVSADLRDAAATRKSLEGTEIAYLTVGLPYDSKVWARDWPTIMRNVIEGCKAVSAKLVFFDNIYLYRGLDLDPITEDHPVDPPSKKGQVRAEIFRMLWDEVERGSLPALVARAADFYGPGSEAVSLLSLSAVEPLSEGKKASWLGNVNRKHSFTYTIDAARATALLGNTPEAYGEVWHLPTDSKPWTGEEWVARVADAFGASPKCQVAGPFVLRLLGIFKPVMRELSEMLYQYDRDYVFSSEKFDRRFPDFRTTPHEEGIKAWLPVFRKGGR